MTTKHTPGPSHEAETRKRINELYWSNLLAKERLIAAAPDMLEALKEIAKGEGAYSRDHLVHASNVIENCIRLANAAIAKATGETQP